MASKPNQLLSIIHSNITMLSLDLCPGHTIDCQFMKRNPIKVGRSVMHSLAIPLLLLVGGPDSGRLSGNGGAT